VPAVASERRHGNLLGRGRRHPRPRSRPVRHPLPDRRVAVRADRVAACRVPMIGQTARAAAFFDRVFELLDQQRTVLRLALRHSCSRLCGTQCLPLRDDDRMCTRKIGRQRIISAHHQQWNHNTRPVSARRIVFGFTKPRSAGRLRLWRKTLPFSANNSVPTENVPRDV
jgi:hypothetical protein